MTPSLIPMLSFLEPVRLWLLLLVPVLVGLYLLLVRRRSQRRRQVGQVCGQEHRL